jgi:CheY-like chemotaxis protein
LQKSCSFLQGFENLLAIMNSMFRILAIDSTQRARVLRWLFAAYLGLNFGESLRAQVAQRVPAIVVLDLNLPGEDGISLCEWLRRTYPQIGIVMLTARVMGVDRTEGYVAGADI